MYAKTASRMITAYCRALFDKDPDKMGSTMANGSLIDAFDHKGYGSHKYIPTERLNDDLGLPQDAGVYGFWTMKDDSYLLLTCTGELACWSGKDESQASWHGLRTPEERV